MKDIIFAILAILVVISCVHHKPRLENKEKPEYVGVNPTLKPFVDEYVQRAKARHLVFNNPVTVGFKVINVGDVIGVCSMTEKFREVDIDTIFWNRASHAKQRILIFHELTHCLCGRNHDFGNGQSYPDSLFGHILDDISFRSPFRIKVKSGYFVDGCGMSIMTPEIASDDCIDSHESEYLEEMFDRCEPY